MFLVRERCVSALLEGSEKSGEYSIFIYRVTTTVLIWMKGQARD